MRTRHIVSLALVAALGLVGCGADGDSLTAQQVADQLAEAHHAGIGQIRRVEEKPGDTLQEAVTVVHAERVVIYEMRDREAAAAHSMDLETSTEAQPVYTAGRFVLRWRTDVFPSSPEFRRTLNERLDKLVEEG